MSSREIAELTGKQHQHVKRDIERMLAKLEIGVSKFGHTYFDSQNKSQTEYHLPKRETIILVSGYSVELRARIVDRWQELEEQVANQRVRPDCSDPAIILGVFEHLQLENSRKDGAYVMGEGRGMIN